MFLHLSLTPFQHSSRILKECRTSAELDWDKPILVVALWEPGLDSDEQVDDGVAAWRVALKTREWPKSLPVQMIKYFEWAYRVVARMRTKDLTVIHAHSIAALPVGVVLKWLTDAPLIYDAHELESEANSLTPLRSKLSRWIERLWMRGADRTITVCDSIADWYAHAYSVERPTVVRNIPIQSDGSPQQSTVLRDTHCIPEEALLFLYQGGLAPGRSIEQLIELFAGLDMQRHLVLMGYGELQDQVCEAALRYSNIHFQPAVPPDRVLHYTASADIGLCLIESTSLSYYYSLPNKLFEYLLCGLPVLVNDLPEQRRIVEQFACGWIVPPSSGQQKALVQSINASSLAAKKSGARKAADNLDWASEAVHLRDLYIEIAGDRGSGPAPKPA